MSSDAQFPLSDPQWELLLYIYLWNKLNQFSANEFDKLFKNYHLQCSK